jgi:hypothetical protein
MKNKIEIGMVSTHKEHEKRKHSQASSEIQTIWNEKSG